MPQISPRPGLLPHFSLRPSNCADKKSWLAASCPFLSCPPQLQPLINLTLLHLSIGILGPQVRVQARIGSASPSFSLVASILLGSHPRIHDNIEDMLLEMQIREMQQYISPMHLRIPLPDLSVVSTEILGPNQPRQTF